MIAARRAVRCAAAMRPIVQPPRHQRLDEKLSQRRPARIRRVAIKLAPLPVGQQQPTTRQMVGGLRPAVPADGGIAVQPAEQHAPALRTRATQHRQHPAEIGRIAHRPFERDEKPLELDEVVARVVADVVDVDIAGFRPDRLDIRCFVGVAAVRHGAVESAPRHAGECGEPLVFFGERARGKDRDRRRVEPAAEQAADRMGAAHLPAHGAIEAVAQSVRIGRDRTEA